MPEEALHPDVELSLDEDQPEPIQFWEAKQGELPTSAADYTRDSLSGASPFSSRS